MVRNVRKPGNWKPGSWGRIGSTLTEWTQRAAGIYDGQSNARSLDFDADALAALLVPIERDAQPVKVIS